MVEPAAVGSLGHVPGDLTAETPLEARLMAEPRWRAGAAWGEPRPGHPEGTIAAHVAEVLANLDRASLDVAARRKLRLVALLHDTFKHQVDPGRPPTGANHHGAIARRFAERHLDDPDVLELLELHEEAYNAWLTGVRRGSWARAEVRVERLRERLGPRLGLYLAFYRADNATGDKHDEPLRWFEALVARGDLGESPGPNRGAGH